MPKPNNIRKKEPALTGVKESQWIVSNGILVLIAMTMGYIVLKVAVIYGGEFPATIGAWFTTCTLIYLGNVVNILRHTMRRKGRK